MKGPSWSKGIAVRTPQLVREGENVSVLGASRDASPAAVVTTCSSGTAKVQNLFVWSGALLSLGLGEGGW